MKPDTEQQLPQSNALAEATVDSLAEVMSRDPEGLSRQDRNRIVEALRAQRQRLQIADAEAPTKARKAPKSSVPLTTIAGANPEDLGL